MEYNLAQIHEAIEASVGDRPCIIFRDRTFTFTDVGNRSRQLANVLLDAGFAVHAERASLAGHESGQDHLALYLYNGNEYLEGMLGAYKARVAPFNVNYRYVAEELAYLLNDSGAKGIVYHAAFAPILAEIRDRLPNLTLLLQVADDSGNELLDGALDYEEALAGAPSELDSAVKDSWSPDDLYILYTGGTTGMPKGVLWRQADIWVTALGGRQLGTPDEWDSLEMLTHNGDDGRSEAPGSPTVHARRRPLDGLQRLRRRQHPGVDQRRRPVRRARSAGPYRRTRGQHRADRRRCIRATTGGGDRSRRPRPLVAAGCGVRWSGVVGGDQEPLPRGGADADDHGRTRCVGDGIAGRAVLGRRPGRHHRHLHPRTRDVRALRGPLGRARPRRRGTRLAGPTGPGPAGLPRRRGKIGADLSGHRRRSVLGAR